MRVTIIRDGDQVYVDGHAEIVDLSHFPDYIHAIQWYDDHGEIEFITDSKGRRCPNVPITDIKPWQPLIDHHQRKKSDAEARARAAASTPKNVGGMDVLD